MDKFSLITKTKRVKRKRKKERQKRRTKRKMSSMKLLITCASTRSPLSLPSLHKLVHTHQKH